MGVVVVVVVVVVVMVMVMVAVAVAVAGSSSSSSSGSSSGSCSRCCCSRGWEIQRKAFEELVPAGRRGEEAGHAPRLENKLDLACRNNRASPKVQGPTDRSGWCLQSRSHGCYTSAHGPCCRFAIAAQIVKCCRWESYSLQLTVGKLRFTRRDNGSSSCRHFQSTNQHRYVCKCMHVCMCVGMHACNACNVCKPCNLCKCMQCVNQLVQVHVCNV